MTDTPLTPAASTAAGRYVLWRVGVLAATRPDVPRETVDELLTASDAIARAVLLPGGNARQVPLSGALQFTAPVTYRQWVQHVRGLLIGQFWGREFLVRYLYPPDGDPAWDE